MTLKEKRVIIVGTCLCFKKKLNEKITNMNWEKISDVVTLELDRMANEVLFEIKFNVSDTNTNKKNESEIVIVTCEVIQSFIISGLEKKNHTLRSISGIEFLTLINSQIDLIISYESFEFLSKTTTTPSSDITTN